MKTLISLFKKLVKLSKQRKVFYAISAVTLIFLLGISYINYTRAGSFAFVDEYYSFVAAYFLENGRAIYSEVFSHHQPLPIFLSLFVQKILNPHSLYQLVLYHRIFVILFSLACMMGLIARFRYLGIFASLLYAPLNFYIFGNLFLAESFIVFPLVYLLMLSWNVLTKQKIFMFDFYLAALCFAFVAWMREPLIMVAILLYGVILLNKNRLRDKLLSVGLVAIISTLILAILPLKEYFNSVVLLNFSGYIQQELGSENPVLGIFKTFFFPFLIPFIGKYNYFHTLLIGLSLAFVLATINLLKLHHWKKVLFILSVLALSNIRVVTPGEMFFNGFHMIPFLGLFITSILLLLEGKFSKPNILVLGSCGFLVIVFLLSLSPFNSYLFERINRTQEFVQNYGTLNSQGEVVKILSKPTDTFFVETWDLLTQWNSGLDSPAKQAPFLPIMYTKPTFKSELQQMFEKTPPTFYHGLCFEGKKYTSPFPKQIEKSYHELRVNGKHSCLYIHNSRFQTITQEQWNQVTPLGYTK